MKIPTDHIELAQIGYEGYWVEMPKSMKEGFLHDFAKVGRAAAAAAEKEGGDDEASRASNIMLLSLVSAWNFDDEAGNPLTLVSKAKSEADKKKVLAEIPVDVLVFLVNRIAGNVQVSDKTKDF